MTAIKQAMLVIYVSPNGRDNWTPILPDAVPEWVKEPRTMGRLVAGEMCCDPALGDKGSDWFRAERVLTPEEKAAQARRERRQSKRAVH